MEVLVILLFIILLFVLVSLRSTVITRLDHLEEEVQRLIKELKDRPAAAAPPPPARPAAGSTPAAPVAPVQAAPAPTPQPVVPAQAVPATPATPAAPKETEPYTPPADITRPHSFQRPTVAAAAGEPSANSEGSVLAGTSAIPNAPFDKSGSQTPPPPPYVPEPPKPGFFERHPDLEKFIGENLISKIGIAILVLAVGFFVKQAIDNDKIGPVGRVGIGLLCGGILISIAHYMRNSYKAFSSILVGGGLAVFYFTIALAFHQYQLFSQSVSFVIMLVITAFAVILSMLYDRQELAIIALVGGFASPFLVSNGNGNYKVLFSYLLILNAGLLVIAYRKSWRLLNLLAFGFTAILFMSWLFTLPAAEPISTFQGGFLFATAFYILFFVINVLHNIRENKKFIASDFGILLANTCFYFGLGLYMLAAMRLAKYQGLFSASMGIFNLAISYFLLRTKKVDTNILYLLIGITLTFISLTAPIQLHGHYITLFWASESVLLYWLARKSGFRIIAVSSQVVWVAMLVSLVMDWDAVYYDIGGRLPVIFNKGLMTALYSAFCCYLLFFLQRKEEGSWFERFSGHVLIIVGSILLFAGGALEIHHQFNYYYPHTDLYVLYLVLYGFVWAAFVAYGGNRWRWLPNTGYAGGLLTTSLVVYIVLTPRIYSLQTDLLVTGLSAHFIAHWVTALIVALMIYHLISWWRQGKAGTELSGDAFAWVIGIAILIYLSAEVQLVVNAIFYKKGRSFSDISEIYIKTGLPILWGLSSFVFIWLGMRYKFKPLRILSLVIFSVTLLKLFLFDIRNIPVAGKIAAFFCLGVILLIVSFMYQRLKKIITKDEENKNI